MLVALTRAVPPDLARCELTFAARRPVHPARAAAQHAAYEDALRAAGCRVERLPALPDHPDSVFVEDAAVVLNECAVVARPGAESRRPETASVAAALAAYRPLHAIEPPGTLDGGDVLRVGRRVFVGLSTRTNEDGARQLAELLAPRGYRVETIAVRGRLHLKSAASGLDDRTLLVDPSAVAGEAFAGLDRVEVDPGEPHGANALRVAASLLVAADAPRTRDRLERAGHRAVPVDNSELAKAEGGLTCCSLILDV